MSRKRITYGAKVEVALTETERALISEHTFIDPDTERLLNLAVRHGAKLVGLMTLGNLDDLLGHVAATANHAKSRMLQAQMDRLYSRLQAVEQRYEENEP